MNRFLTLLAIVLLTSATLAGCSGKKDSGGGTTGKLDDSKTYDKVTAGSGFRVSGSLTGTGASVSGSMTMSVVDSSATDANGAKDKADFVVNVTSSDGFSAVAQLKTIGTAQDLGLGGEFFGGVALNKQINGKTNIGYADLPEDKGFVLLTGLARLRLAGTNLDNPQLVQVFLTHGLHDADGKLRSEPDKTKAEVGVVFPGSKTSGNPDVPSVSDGFLYFYFTNINAQTLSNGEKSDVGKGLVPPERPNLPPSAVAQVKLENGTAATSGVLDAGNKFLNVTLDATASLDPDGTIEAYSWDVKEYNATGTLVALNKTQGASASFSFQNPGLKQISLRVIDNKGAIANASVYFFADYHVKLNGVFTGTSGLGGGGTNAGCREALNCLTHQISVFFGASNMTVSAPVATGSGTCNGPTLNLKDPKDQVIATGEGPLKVDDPAKLALVGKYKLEVIWTLQVMCTYTVDTYAGYHPATTPAA